MRLGRRSAAAGGDGKAPGTCAALIEASNQIYLRTHACQGTGLHQGILISRDLVLRRACSTARGSSGTGTAAEPCIREQALGIS